METLKNDEQLVDKLDLYQHYQFLVRLSKKKSIYYGFYRLFMVFLFLMAHFKKVSLGSGKVTQHHTI